METVTLRRYQPSDAEPVALILRDAWHTAGPSDVYNRAEAAADLASCLSFATFAIVAELDGRVVGICCAHGATPSPDAAAWERERDAALGRLRKIDAVAARRYEDYLAASWHVNERLLRDAGIEGDAEVVLLAVDAAARGRAVGRRLITRVADRLAREGFAHAFLFTDTDCSWQFYERLGLERRGAARPEDPLLPEEMYLYRLPVPLPPSAEGER